MDSAGFSGCEKNPPASLSAFKSFSTRSRNAASLAQASSKYAVRSAGSGNSSALLKMVYADSAEFTSGRSLFDSSFQCRNGRQKGTASTPFGGPGCFYGVIQTCSCKGPVP